MSIAPELFGLILAGGKSSRMGSDKSLLTYHEVPQKDFLPRLLKKFCTQVFTSVRNVEDATYHNPIKDVYNFRSPLNGIMSAFQLYPEKAWLCVAVDMPNVNEAILNFLITHRDTTKVATCFLDSEESLPEPLLTIWEPKAWPELKNFQSKGETSPREFLHQSDVCKWVVPDKSTLLNVNTPEDFDTFLRSQKK